MTPMPARVLLPLLLLATGAGFASPVSVAELHQDFVESVEEADKSAALARLARTPPATLKDVQWLYDIFTRFPAPGPREAVMASIGLLDERSGHLEPAFLQYLAFPEADARLLAVNGAFRIRAARALPLIKDIAKKPFKARDPLEIATASERDEWWVTYEALSALAQWEGAKAYPLLRARADEAPRVARLMGAHLWKESLPQLARWARSGGADSEKALEGLKAPAPAQALRETRAEMLKSVRDPKAPRGLRHQLALKVGTTSSDEEVGALLEERETAKDAETKLMLTAALFASRSPRIVPLLEETVRKSPEPRARLGALVQLRSMTPAEKTRPLVETMAESDPDAENREAAAALLKAP